MTTFPCPGCGGEITTDHVTVNFKHPRTGICPIDCDESFRLVPLKFYSGLVEDVMAGRKRKTFRYEDEKEIKAGNVLAIMETVPTRHGDADPPLRGFATVIDVEERPIEEFTEYHFAWHTGSDGPEQLAESMRSIYREPIALQTTVKYIAFEYHE